MNEIIGFNFNEISKNIISECHECCCIPASIDFIIKCIDPNSSINQNKIFNLMNVNSSFNFESAQQTLSHLINISVQGFRKEDYKNIDIQISDWKEFILKQIKSKIPVAVCFLYNGKMHCKVIFKVQGNLMSIFNPADFNSYNRLASKSIPQTCGMNNPNCKFDRNLLGTIFYSIIETYTWDNAIIDLKKNILQMQVLSISLK